MEIQQVIRSINSKFPNFSLSNIFDVGANVGQTSIKFSQLLPNAKIFAFEPIPSSFSLLKENLIHSQSNIECRQLALSNVSGLRYMTNRPLSPTNAMLRESFKSKTNISVMCETGDNIVSELGIESISYLKIDTEGHEMEVLHGFRNSLEKHTINFLQIEVGLNPENQWHVPFEVVKKFLEDFDYRIFSIISMAWEPKVGNFLRRCDVIYVSKNLISAS